MQLTSETSGQDEKLDGLLSLLMHEYEGNKPSVPQIRFYERYSDFFGEELHSLQEILFEDGLIRCSVGPEGLEMEITPKGISFMSKGGYSSAIREEMICHDDALRVQKNHKFWNTVVTVAFLLAITIGYYLRHKQA